MVELNIQLIAIVVIAIVIIYFVTFRTEHYTATNAEQSSTNQEQTSIAPSHQLTAAMRQSFNQGMSPVVAVPQQVAVATMPTQFNPFHPEPSSTAQFNPFRPEPSLPAQLNKPFYVEPSSGLYTGGLYLEGQYNYDADRNRQHISQISNDTNNFRELVITGNAYRDGKTRQVGIYDKLNVYGELCVGNEREKVCMGMNELKNIGKLVTNEPVGAGAF